MYMYIFININRCVYIHICIFIDTFIGNIRPDNCSARISNLIPLFSIIVEILLSSFCTSQYGIIYEMRNNMELSMKKCI